MRRNASRHGAPTQVQPGYSSAAYCGGLLKNPPAGRRLRRMGRPTLAGRKAKQKRFLKAFAELGTVAAASVKSGVEDVSHYRWLKSSAAYRKAYAQAEERSISRLEAEAIRRASEGTKDPVFYAGSKCGDITRYSDVLLIFLLKAKRPDVYRERLDARILANVNQASTVTVVHEYHDVPGALPAGPLPLVTLPAGEPSQDGSEPSQAPSGSDNDGNGVGESV